VIQPLSPAALKGMIADGSRALAILDAREEGEFGQGHLFWAVPCPLSRAEPRLAELIPPGDVALVCVDGGGGQAQALAGIAMAQGHTRVHVLTGGTPAWAAAGYEVFSGVNVPSKAFGEWAEHHFGTESLDPPELAALQASGQPMVLLDSRTPEEFERMTIPGAVNVPGGELVWRIGEFAPDAGTTIVINCAGRTRSIMGAESLRRAGLPNRILALRNGTMGWELAGYTCEHGARRAHSPGTPPGAALAAQRAGGFASSAGVRTLPASGLAALLRDGHPTYRLDVRARDEYLAGHIPGFSHAPGGQLVQATDGWVALRPARIILTDMGDGTRARMTGAWLSLLGQWEVLVLDGVPPDGGLETGPAPLAEVQQRPSITVAELAGMAGAVVIDLARSVDYRAGHIAGAIWGVRTRLAAPPPAALVVVTAPDERLAHLAVAELAALTTAPVRVLAGGTAAWRAAGLPMQADRTIPADAQCIDFHLRPYDRNSGVEEAMRAYLSWEIDLVHAVERDGDSRFGEPG